MELYQNRRRVSSNASFTIVAANTKIRELNRRCVLNDIPSESASTESLDDNSLNYLTTALFSNILGDALKALYILDKCNNSILVTMAGLQMKDYLHKKYNIEMPAAANENVINYPLDSDENKIKKLSSDRKMCMDVLEQLYKELCHKRTYEELTEFTKLQALKDNPPLVTEVEEKKLQYRELKQKLRSQRNCHRFRNMDAIEMIDKLQQLIGDTEQMSSIRSNYIVNWKNAQREQHEQIIQDSQEKNIHSIRHFKVEKDKEFRAHEEIELFNNIVMAEQIAKVDETMLKYEEHVDEMNLKIQIMMSEHAAAREKREALERLLAKRTKEMDAWVKYKNDRAATVALANRKTNAAITVQAWWRGILVRQRLGPFNPKKEKPKKGKKRFSKASMSEVNDGVGA